MLITFVVSTTLGFRCRDDVREVTALLASIGVDVHVVAPLGATPEQLRTLTEADLNVVLYPEIALTTASWLQRVHGMPMVRAVPLGVGATREFLEEVGRVGGGAALAEPAFRSIAWRGRYLVIGFAGGSIPALPLNLPLLKGADIVGVFWGEFTRREPQAFQQGWSQLLQWYREGKVRPAIDCRWPMRQLRDAYARMASRQVQGKVLLVNA